jgi:hypothetical protein
MRSFSAIRNHVGFSFQAGLVMGSPSRLLNVPAGMRRNESCKLLQFFQLSLQQELLLSLRHGVQTVVRRTEVRSEALDDLQFRVPNAAREKYRANSDSMFHAVAIDVPDFVAKRTPERD